MKKAIITQSNYIPWKGYFDSIAAVDVFVVYDDMQYTRRDWRNRNMIKTPSGVKWLTIPVEVKGKYFQKIKDTRIADPRWSKNHWEIIRQSYKDAPYFREMAAWIEPLYMECTFEFLTEVNLYFIEAINKFLDIRTTIRFSSEFKLEEEKTMRLVNICKDIGASDYYSGISAKAYMNEALFEENNLRLHYWDYSGYPQYSQLHGDFIHEVSILDLIFNCGIETTLFMKFYN